MAYIGNEIRQYSDRVVLDSLTASATASYTLQLNSVNFVPSSAESLTVSLNGVIQKPGSSYTVSSSTLTFSSSLSSSDSIDFIIAERGITLQTPSAGSVGTSQLASGAVNNSKIASDAAIATTKLGTGAIIQVVENSTSSTLTTSSSTFVKAPLEVTITPTSSSSKIYISAQGMINSQQSNNWIYYSLYRGTSTNLGNSSIGLGGNYSNNDSHVPAVVAMLDSPSTTSATTYSIYVRTTGGASMRYNPDGHENNIVAMEIAG